MDKKTILFLFISVLVITYCVYKTISISTERIKTNFARECWAKSLIESDSIKRDSLISLSLKYLK